MDIMVLIKCQKTTPLNCNCLLFDCPVMCIIMFHNWKVIAITVISMYAVPVDVLRLFIWVWLVSLVCIIKLYLMLVFIKRLYEFVIIMKNLGY